ncbi:hypothetical protein NO1_1018 [Candidatus Termititenax aidoneus]|uniref:Uncharacterized protein n=1 Tax=Termititenax aidoneus TaxID=2218524 RepID=A0A388TAG1_TERA1|nr:hypothetical protein NO1_1018 [Candidatus Termititenax aidoneus]
MGIDVVNDKGELYSPDYILSAKNEVENFFVTELNMPLPANLDEKFTKLWKLSKAKHEELKKYNAYVERQDNYIEQRNAAVILYSVTTSVHTYLAENKMRILAQELLDTETDLINKAGRYYMWMDSFFRVPYVSADESQMLALLSGKAETNNEYIYLASSIIKKRTDIARDTKLDLYNPSISLTKPLAGIVDYEPAAAVQVKEYPLQQEWDINSFAALSERISDLPYIFIESGQTIIDWLTSEDGSLTKNASEQDIQIGLQLAGIFVKDVISGKNLILPRWEALTQSENPVYGIGNLYLLIATVLMQVSLWLALGKRVVFGVECFVNNRTGAQNEFFFRIGDEDFSFPAKSYGDAKAKLLDYLKNDPRYKDIVDQLKFIDIRQNRFFRSENGRDVPPNNPELISRELDDYLRQLSIDTRGIHAEFDKFRYKFGMELGKLAPKNKLLRFLYNWIYKPVDWFSLLDPKVAALVVAPIRDHGSTEQTQRPALAVGRDGKVALTDLDTRQIQTLLAGLYDKVPRITGTNANDTELAGIRTHEDLYNYVERYKDTNETWRRDIVEAIKNSSAYATAQKYYDIVDALNESFKNNIAADGVRLTYNDLALPLTKIQIFDPELPSSTQINTAFIGKKGNIDHTNPDEVILYLGRDFWEADTEERKRILAEALQKIAPAQMPALRQDSGRFVADNGVLDQGIVAKVNDMLPETLLLKNGEGPFVYREDAGKWYVGDKELSVEVHQNTAQTELNTSGKQAVLKLGDDFLAYDAANADAVYRLSDMRGRLGILNISDEIRTAFTALGHANVTSEDLMQLLFSEQTHNSRDIANANIILEAITEEIESLKQDKRADENITPEEYMNILIRQNINTINEMYSTGDVKFIIETITKGIVDLRLTNAGLCFTYGREKYSLDLSDITNIAQRKDLPEEVRGVFSEYFWQTYYIKFWFNKKKDGEYRFKDLTEAIRMDRDIKYGEAFKELQDKVLVYEQQNSEFAGAVRQVEKLEGTLIIENGKVKVLDGFITWNNGQLLKEIANAVKTPLDSSASNYGEQQARILALFREAWWREDRTKGNWRNDPSGKIDVADRIYSLNSRLAELPSEMLGKEISFDALIMALAKTRGQDPSKGTVLGFRFDSGQIFGILTVTNNKNLEAPCGFGKTEMGIVSNLLRILNGQIPITAVPDLALIEDAQKRADMMMPILKLFAGEDIEFGMYDKDNPDTRGVLESLTPHSRRMIYMTFDHLAFQLEADKYALMASGKALLPIDPSFNKKVAFTFDELDALIKRGLTPYQTNISNQQLWSFLDVVRKKGQDILAALTKYSTFTSDFVETLNAEFMNKIIENSLAETYGLKWQKGKDGKPKVTIDDAEKWNRAMAEGKIVDTRLIDKLWGDFSKVNETGMSYAEFGKWVRTQFDYTLLSYAQDHVFREHYDVQGGKVMLIGEGGTISKGSVLHPLETDAPAFVGLQYAIEAKEYGRIRNREKLYQTQDGLSVVMEVWEVRRALEILSDYKVAGYSGTLIGDVADALKVATMATANNVKVQSAVFLKKADMDAGVVKTALENQAAKYPSFIFVDHANQAAYVRSLFVEPWRQNLLNSLDERMRTEALPAARQAMLEVYEMIKGLPIDKFGTSEQNQKIRENLNLNNEFPIDFLELLNKGLNEIEDKAKHIYIYDHNVEESELILARASDPEAIFIGTIRAGRGTNLFSAYNKVLDDINRALNNPQNQGKTFGMLIGELKQKAEQELNKLRADIKKEKSAAEITRLEAKYAEWESKLNAWQIITDEIAKADGQARSGETKLSGLEINEKNVKEFFTPGEKNPYSSVFNGRGVTGIIYGEAISQDVYRQIIARIGRKGEDGKLYIFANMESEIWKDLESKGFSMMELLRQFSKVDEKTGALVYDGIIKEQLLAWLEAGREMHDRQTREITKPTPWGEQYVEEEIRLLMEIQPGFNDPATIENSLFRVQEVTVRALYDLAALSNDVTKLNNQIKLSFGFDLKLTELPQSVDDLLAQVRENWLLINKHIIPNVKLSGDAYSGVDNANSRYFLSELDQAKIHYNDRLKEARRLTLPGQIETIVTQEIEKQLALEEYLHVKAQILAEWSKELREVVLKNSIGRTDLPPDAGGRSRLTAETGKWNAAQNRLEIVYRYRADDDVLHRVADIAEAERFGQLDSTDRNAAALDQNNPLNRFDNPNFTITANVQKKLTDFSKKYPVELPIVFVIRNGEVIDFIAPNMDRVVDLSSILEAKNITLLPDDVLRIYELIKNAQDAAAKVPAGWTADKWAEYKLAEAVESIRSYFSGKYGAEIAFSIKEAFSKFKYVADIQAVTIGDAAMSFGDFENYKSRIALQQNDIVRGGHLHAFNEEITYQDKAVGMDTIVRRPDGSWSYIDLERNVGAGEFLPVFWRNAPAGAQDALDAYRAGVADVEETRTITANVNPAGNTDNPRAAGTSVERIEPARIPTEMSEIARIEAVMRAAQEEDMRYFDEINQKFYADPALKNYLETYDSMRARNSTADELLKLRELADARFRELQNELGYNWRPENRLSAECAAVLKPLADSKGAFMLGLIMSACREFWAVYKSGELEGPELSRHIANFVYNIPENTGFGVMCSIRDNILTDVSINTWNSLFSGKALKPEELAQALFHGNEARAARGLKPLAQKNIDYIAGCLRTWAVDGLLLFSAGFFIDGFYTAMSRPEISGLLDSNDPYDREKFQTALFITCVTEGINNLAFEVPSMVLARVIPGASGALKTLLRSGLGVGAVIGIGQLTEPLKNKVIVNAFNEIERIRMLDEQLGVTRAPLSREEIRRQSAICNTVLHSMQSVVGFAGTAVLSTVTLPPPLALPAVALVGANALFDITENLLYDNINEYTLQSIIALEKSTSVYKIYNVNELRRIDPLPIETAKIFNSTGILARIKMPLSQMIGEKHQAKFNAYWNDLIYGLQMNDPAKYQNWWNNLPGINTLASLVNYLTNGLGSFGDDIFGNGVDENTSRVQFFEFVMSYAIYFMVKEYPELYPNSAELMVDTKHNSSAETGRYVDAVYDETKWYFEYCLNALEFKTTMQAWEAMLGRPKNLSDEAYIGELQNNYHISIDSRTGNCTAVTLPRQQTGFFLNPTRPASIADLRQSGQLFDVNKPLFVSFTAWFFSKCQTDNMSKYISGDKGKITLALRSETIRKEMLAKVRDNDAQAVYDLVARYISAAELNELLTLFFNEKILAEKNVNFQAEYSEFNKSPHSFWSVSQLSPSVSSLFIAEELLAIDFCSGNAAARRRVATLRQGKPEVSDKNISLERLNILIAHWENSPEQRERVRKYLAGEIGFAASVHSGSVSPQEWNAYYNTLPYTVKMRDGLRVLEPSIPHPATPYVFTANGMEFSPAMYKYYADRALFGSYSAGALKQLEYLCNSSIEIPLDKAYAGWKAGDYLTLILNKLAIPEKMRPIALEILQKTNGLDENAILTTESNIYVQVSILSMSPAGSSLTAAAEQAVRKDRRPADDGSPLTAEEQIKLARILQTGILPNETTGQQARSTQIFLQPASRWSLEYFDRAMLPIWLDSYREYFVKQGEKNIDKALDAFLYFGSNVQQQTSVSIILAGSGSTDELYINQYKTACNWLKTAGLITDSTSIPEVLQILMEYKDFAEKQMPVVAGTETLINTALDRPMLNDTVNARTAYVAYAELAKKVNAACGYTAVNAGMLTVFLKLIKDVKDTDAPHGAKILLLLNMLLKYDIKPDSALAGNMLAILDSKPLGRVSLAQTIADLSKGGSLDLSYAILLQEWSQTCLTTYTVVSGDTLSGIARKHNISLQILYRLNPEIDPANGFDVARLKPGAKLAVPPAEAVLRDSAGTEERIENTRPVEIPEQLRNLDITYRRNNVRIRVFYDESKKVIKIGGVEYNIAAMRSNVYALTALGQPEHSLQFKNGYWFLDGKLDD